MGNAGKTLRVIVHCKTNATVWDRFFRAALYSADSNRETSNTVASRRFSYVFV